jgi:hypothetical protein
VTAQGESNRLLTFRSGGWVLVSAAVLTAAVLVWGLLGIVVADRSESETGGRERSGFSLESAIVPVDRIVAGSEPGVIHALTEPAMISAAEVDEINRRERGKHLVDDEFVLGVEFSGEARAYPIRILQWHEIINDTVAGVPVAVTYNGLCDAAVVFDRVVGGRVVEFEVSGLLYNSNLLMFIKGEMREPGEESLWSQVEARAVTGSLAGGRLSVLPCALVTWGQWKERYPDTLALGPNPDPRRERYYDRDAYGSYRSSDVLKFPVAPLPPRGERPLKARMIAVPGGNGAARAFSIDEIRRGAPAGSGKVTVAVNGEEYVAEVFSDPPAALMRTSDGRLAPVIYCSWFAWYASTAGDAAAADEGTVTR